MTNPLTAQTLQMVWDAMTPAERELWMRNVQANANAIAEEQIPAWTAFLADKRGCFA